MNQLTAVKTRYPQTYFTWPYRGLRCRPIDINDDDQDAHSSIAGDAEDSDEKDSRNSNNINNNTIHNKNAIRLYSIAVQ